MPPGKQAKEVKIEFKMEVNKMVSAMKDVQKSFQESTQNIDKMSDSFKNMETKLHLVNMKMADMTKNISAMTQTNMIMSKDIKESFSQWGTLLNDNNQKITSAITKMIALNKENQRHREEMSRQRSELSQGRQGIDATFLRLKMLNMGFNLIRSSAKSAINELMELESSVKTIATITGEATGFIESNIKRLSIQSGISMDKIGKALQDAANEGNSLTKSMEKINAAMLISQKSGISFENAIARVDDISDQFGKSADYVSASMLHLNLSSERAMKVFGRLARDVKEANISFEDAGAMMSILANKAGVSESSLQISMRAMLNGIQRLGKEGSAEFMNNILPRWNSLSDAQKRIIEQRLGLDKNSMVLDEIGKRYGEIHQRALEVVKDQDKILEQSKKNPETAIKKMNEAWINFISILKDAMMTLDHMVPRFATVTAFANAVSKVAEHVKSIRNSQIESEIRGKDTQIADFEASIANVEALRAKTEQGSQAWIDYGKSIDGAKLQIKRVQKERAALIDSISEGDAPIAASAGLMKSLVGAGKSALGGRKSVLWGGMVDAPGINLDVLKSEKTSDKDEIQSFKSSLVSINTNFNIEKEHYGKLDALQRKKIELEKLYQDTTVHTNKMAQDHGTESETYTKKMKSILGEIGLALAKTRADIAEINRGSSIRENKKDSLENDKLLIEKIDLKKQELKLAFENKTINSVEYSSGLLQLNSMLVTMKDRNRAQEISNKLGIDSVKIIEDRSELIKSIELSISKMNNKEPDVERKQDQDLRKITLQKRRAGRLTPADELKLLQEEATERRRIAGPLGVQQVRQKAEMEMHAYQQLADQFAQQGLANEARTQLAKAELIKQTRDKQIQAILDAETAESASLQKRREEWDRTHFTWREAGEATGQMLKSSLEQSIDVLITKTGSLKDVWKSFESQLLSMFAREALMQGIRMLLDFGGVTRAGKGFFSSVVRGMGFSSGTGVGGVPGYASGTGMMGTDTVPAMLTPGEIVLDRNASDVFRGMAANGGGMGGITVIIQSNPSLLGNREELIRLDTALNNPIVRTSSDRRRI